MNNNRRDCAGGSVWLEMLPRKQTLARARLRQNANNPSRRTQQAVFPWWQLVRRVGEKQKKRWESSSRKSVRDLVGEIQMWERERESKTRQLPLIGAVNWNLVHNIWYMSNLKCWDSWSSLVCLCGDFQSIKWHYTAVGFGWGETGGRRTHTHTHTRVRIRNERHADDHCEKLDTIDSIISSTQKTLQKWEIERRYLHRSCNFLKLMIYAKCSERKRKKFGVCVCEFKKW